MCQWACNLVFEITQDLFILFIYFLFIIIIIILSKSLETLRSIFKGFFRILTRAYRLLHLCPSSQMWSIIIFDGEEHLFVIFY